MNLIINHDSDLSVPEEWKILFENIMSKYLRQEHLPDHAEVGLTFVNDEEIQTLNAEYRDVHCVTDVLSFPMYDTFDHLEKENPLLLGDIVISIARASEQAEEYGHSLLREMSYLFTHGLLHLAGYDHMNEDERSEMRQQEESILGALGITRDE